MTKTKKKLSEKEMLGILAGMLLFVVRGLRAGSITSKPIIRTDPDSEQYPIVTLETEIWDALGKCGISEKK